MSYFLEESVYLYLQFQAIANAPNLHYLKRLRLTHDDLILLTVKGPLLQIYADFTALLVRRQRIFNWKPLLLSFSG